MKHLIAALLLTLPLTATAEWVPVPDADTSGWVKVPGTAERSADVDYACRGTGASGKIVIGVYEMGGTPGIWEDNRSNVLPGFRAPSNARSLRRWITTWGENYAVITVNTYDLTMNVVWVEPDNTYTYNGKCREGQ